MAGIEPLGSVMSYQAQPVVQNQAQESGVKTMEGQAIESEAPVIDDKTLSLSKAQNSDMNNEQSDDEEGKLDQEMMRQAMKELTKKSANVQAEFGIHEKTNRITIKMVDKNTKKVIKELPPEKMLDMIARMWEMSGLVVDEKR